ncbi:hypothetical protein CLAFUW4_06752 [Fulvia fulva]|uniref:Uncharacterized protein n=1 Tax=Passalora fulva TaxID=5499 RepID=A0A9Q8PAT0_PASFU|nr:uncharacterized protein CLAFUR5_06889 [Fulvia fulva]KAK4621858.1 hypothetical protein CLAFUR4_06760 [Fulvia fulva]KAK4623329.1 hypothetical protein CLAFUR0_06755 [Fulvia fulva]UJO19068.1 hypothetical protein CLAFUR5_06889 [Fulvia fulva]WPV16795.1 hypothetical protein CLAFUW4_06752 [Fulvia fulva]WPV31748.1 hypothetical protein CLAFUW7_06751 [Fulvia fulva]
MATFRALTMKYVWRTARRHIDREYSVLTMALSEVDIPEPSQWNTHFAAASNCLADGSPTNVTIHLYGPLISDEDWIRVDESDFARPFDPTHHSKVVKPVVDNWIKVIRETKIQPSHYKTQSQEDSPEQSDNTLRFTLDVTQPLDIDNSTRHLLLQHEARSTVRIAALLNKIFRPVGRQLEVSVKGARCWCTLREKERHVVMPKGLSYPVDRASHMQEQMEYMRAN